MTSAGSTCACSNAHAYASSKHTPCINRGGESLREQFAVSNSVAKFVGVLVCLLCTQRKVT